MFFDESNHTLGKEWKRRYLDSAGRKFQITKVGEQCDFCTKKYERPIYRSIRVEYQKFKGRDGVERQEFSWLSSKCNCMVAIVYKNGRVVFNPSREYSKAVRQFDDLSKIPSGVHVYIKK